MTTNTWNDNLKARLADLYTEMNPTPETTTQCVKDATEALNTENDTQFSANGARMILTKAGVYVAQGTAASTSAAKPKAASGAATGGTRVSKESAINELRTAIADIGGECDDDILSKLTGKAALYFATIIRKAA